MDNVFLALMILSIASIVYSFVKKLNNKFKFGCIGATIIFFILFGITTLEQAKEKETKKAVLKNQQQKR